MIEFALVERTEIRMSGFLLSQEWQPAGASRGLINEQGRSYEKRIYTG